ncbi:LUD domain-containing protein [Tamlana agarivorans]|uniref:LUD domain-containing protein n=1 Tax=Pseudotamlana agarivorans TaxID=481183 RepID=A0ACC5U954_9FLAO|nr:LUD domain-containing protein [Tamlana agarivorans]MBU2950862.1 LUD domain-containing protein [Tamlana agarivorans]
MSSRDAILSKIKDNKPDLLELPTINVDVFSDSRNVEDEFILKVEVAGGQVLKAASNDAVLDQINTMFPDSKVKYSTLENTADFNTVDFDAIKSPKELEDLDVLILESEIGVAENGAVWLKDATLPMRVLPFITKHLVIVLNKENLVPFMHQAYGKLIGEDHDFGVFLAGPSKTADIEQSLVIGAHGALSLTLFLK